MLGRIAGLWSALHALRPGASADLHWMSLDKVGLYWMSLDEVGYFQAIWAPEVPSQRSFDSITNRVFSKTGLISVIAVTNQSVFFIQSW